MRAGLDGIIHRQGGVFARHQAIARGITPREFTALVGPTGPWRRVRYGVYTTRELWNSLDHDGRRKLCDRAALLVCDEATVLTCTSAARALRLPVHEAADDLAHVTRTGTGQSPRVEAGIKHHLGTIDQSEIVRVDGLVVSDAIRTTVDLTREFGYRTGLVAADAALRLGASRDELLERVAALTTEPRGPVIRAVARLADGRAQTPLETLGRILLHDMGIDDLELQWVIHFPDGGRAETDLYSKSLNHVFECDGRTKYREQVDDWGRALSAEDVVWMEKKREDKIRGLSVGVSRIYWWDTQPQNFGAASTRLWREVESQHTDRRYRPPGA